MSLHLHAYNISTPRNRAMGSSSCLWSTKQPLVRVVGGDNRVESKMGVRGLSLKVNASLDGGAAAPATTATAVVGQVTEVSKDTFWPVVNGAGEKTVVLDMYTQWCGPCKVIAPKYQELSEKYTDVIFLKLDCNQDNKPLAKELGMKVVPTFKILKNNKIVKEITGAKYNELVAAIESVRSS